MKNPVIAIGAVLVCLAFVPFSRAETPSLASCQCPVSGKPVKADASTKYEGQTLYFCCKNCRRAFQKDSHKYAAKANMQLVATGQAVQVCCPISGRPFDQATKIEIGGASVAFCCDKCQAKATSADDDGKVAMCFGNLGKCFTTQTVCPISGKPIDPTAMLKYEGKPVYFCCENCPKTFQADPKKHAQNLK